MIQAGDAKTIQCMVLTVVGLVSMYLLTQALSDKHISAIHRGAGVNVEFIFEPYIDKSMDSCVIYIDVQYCFISKRGSWV